MVTPEEARISANWLQVHFGDGHASGMEAVEALRDLAAQVEALQADAARWEWLKANALNSGDKFCMVAFDMLHANTTDKWDEMADSAREQS